MRDNDHLLHPVSMSHTFATVTCAKEHVSVAFIRASALVGVDRVLGLHSPLAHPYTIRNSTVCKSDV